MQQIDTNASYLLQTLHGLYAGLCFLTLLVFPISDAFDPSNTNATSYSPQPLEKFSNVPFDDTGVIPYPLEITTIAQMTMIFIMFYAPVAMAVSRVFTFVGTGAVLATIDGGGMTAPYPTSNNSTSSSSSRYKTSTEYPEDTLRGMRRWWKTTVSSSTNSLPLFSRLLKWWRRRHGRARRISGILAVLLTSASYICSILMMKTEDRLSESSTTIFGGIYGGPGWFNNKTLVERNEYLMRDLEDWRVFNTIRGFTGVFGWGLACLARRLADRVVSNLKRRWKRRGGGTSDMGHSGRTSGSAGDSGSSFWGYVFGGWLTTSKASNNSNLNGGRRTRAHGDIRKANSVGVSGGGGGGAEVGGRNSTPSPPRRSTILSTADLRGTLDWLKA
jgi:hypothetical protein